MDLAFDNNPIRGFVVEGRLPGLNDIIAAARAHPQASASQKRKATRACEEAILRAVGGDRSKIEPFSHKIGLVITWIEKNKRRDPDNVYAGVKFILDAMVNTGVIVDDSPRWVGTIANFPTVDSARPRVIVDIVENGSIEWRSL